MTTEVNMNVFTQFQGNPFKSGWNVYIKLWDKSCRDIHSELLDCESKWKM